MILVDWSAIARYFSAAIVVSTALAAIAYVAGKGFEVLCEIERGRRDGPE